MARRPGRPPERFVWAVDNPDVKPGDHILEVGFGRGVAAALICQRLRGGRLVALDRSAKAIAAAAELNAQHVSTGTAQFETVALEDVEPTRFGRFDKVLAINVNLFWVRPAQTELDLIVRLLRPNGRLLLVYDPPDADNLARLEDVLLDHLNQAGYTSTTASRTAEQSSLLSVTALPSLQHRR